MLKIAVIALALCACATPEKPTAPEEQPRIIVSCGTLRWIGMLIVIENGERGGMVISCGEEV